MISDPIVEEVRKYRQEHAKRYGNDLRRIAEALKQKEKQSSRKIIDRGPKPLLHNTVS